MAHTVRLARRAFDDIDGIVSYIEVDSPVNARRWQDQLFGKIAALNFSPRGCSLAPEQEYAPFELRQTLFGRYRILFTIIDEESSVFVLTVRHSARRLIPPDELVGLT